MKKLSIFFAILLVIIAIIGFKYVSYRVEYTAIKQDNAEYEKYKEKEELSGLDIATIINKTIDKNTKNKIEKDDKGMFIPNDKNSIEVEIYMLDNETTYKMETIYNGGTEQFIRYYANQKFKCSKIEYHKNTGRIKYILFEQIQTS